MEELFTRPTIKKVAATKVKVTNTRQYDDEEVGVCWKLNLILLLNSQYLKSQEVH